MRIGVNSKVGCALALLGCSLPFLCLRTASAIPSVFDTASDSQMFSNPSPNTFKRAVSDISTSVSRTASAGALNALGSPMPLQSFQNTLSNTVMTAAGQTGARIGAAVGGAVLGQTGAHIGTVLGSRVGYNAGAAVLSGNLSNIRMPWKGGNPIPGAILGGVLGNMLSSGNLKIPSINIPAIGGAANGAINSALNGAAGGALGGAFGSALSGGQLGQGAIQGAIGGAASGLIGSALGGAGMGAGLGAGISAGIGAGISAGIGAGMGMGAVGSMGRTGPDGFPSNIPRGGRMPNMQNPMNGGMTNPFGGIGNMFGQTLLNIIVQALLQAVGLPPSFGMGGGPGAGPGMSPGGFPQSAPKGVFNAPKDGSAPISGPFQAAFNKCAPGCSYTSWGIWGDERHQARASCHNSGSAIDIHDVTCNGQTISPGTSAFGSFVQCMSSDPTLYVIHGNAQHQQHAHIALRSCEQGGIGKYRTR